MIDNIHDLFSALIIIVKVWVSVVYIVYAIPLAVPIYITIQSIIFSFLNEIRNSGKMLLLCQSSNRQLINVSVFFHEKYIFRLLKMINLIMQWSGQLVLIWHVETLSIFTFTICQMWVIANAPQAFSISQSSETYEFLAEFQKILSLLKLSISSIKRSPHHTFFQYKMICLEDSKAIFLQLFINPYLRVVR